MHTLNIIIFLYLFLGSSGTECPENHEPNTLDGSCICARGYFMDISSPGCSACSQGEYQPEPGSNSCLQCPAGTFNDETGKTECNPCPLGTVNPDSGKTLDFCIPCLAGYYSDVEAKSCLPCPPGRYNPIIGQSSETACVPCEAGTYNSDPGQGTCLQCGVGTYSSDTGQLTCTPCDIGKYNPDTGKSVETACIQCKPGTYNPDPGQAACIPCGVGKYNPDIGRSSEAACIQCEPGTYNPDPGQASCIQCESGKYNPNSGQSLATACTPCKVGMYNPDPGQAACIPCEAGKSNPNIGGSLETACVPCKVGTYNPNQGQAVCTSCEAGKYNPVIGQSLATACLPCNAGTYNPNTGEGAVTACKPCQAGTYNELQGQASCTPCAAGSYNINEGETSCIPCPAGTYNPFIGESTTQACVSCEAGTYSSEGSAECTPCQPGTYSENSGSSECTSCSAGKYNPDERMTSITACFDCPKGKYSEERSPTCTSCEAGTYSDTEGSPTCLECPAGTYNPNTGKTSLLDCIECPAGSHSDMPGSSKCNYCPKGYYNYLPNLSYCLKCPEGTYNNEKGMTKCKNCPSKTYNDNKGQEELESCLSCSSYVAVTESSCELCIEGTYKDNTGQSSSSSCNYCPSGKNKIGYASECLKCPPGTYSNAKGSTMCMDCPAGTYNNVEGATECIKCPKGTKNSLTKQMSPSSCTKCPLGYYNGIEGETKCTHCYYGRYADEEGSVSCKSCPEGTANPKTTQTSISACLPCDKGRFTPITGDDYCSHCDFGTYNEDIGQTSCTSCPPGTYNYRLGQTQLSKCLDCPKGTYNPDPGKSSCTKCPLNSYNDLVGQTSSSVCTPCNTYGQITDLSKCVDCPVGTFKDNTAQGAESSCVYCPKGKYNTDNGVDECTPCPGGTFNDQPGQESCTKCPVGTYSDVEGAITCKLCPRGTYSNSTGNSDPLRCNGCPLGSYSNNEGVNICESCPKGTYNPSSGKKEIIDCLPCPVGSYGNMEKEDYCLDCPIGTFNSDTGKDSLLDCKACPIGTYNDLIRQSSCKGCPVGTYNDVTGQIVCKRCPIGTYNDITGQSSCADCPMGSYNGAEGQSVCTKCPVGTYGPSTKQVSISGCTECPIKTYNPSTGKTTSSDCLQCPIGTYNDLTGRSSCKDCPQGTYNNKIGVSICTNCMSGLFADSLAMTQCNECPYGNYSPDPTINHCQPCHKLCKRCYGPNNNQCYECWIDVPLSSPFEDSTCRCKDGAYFEETAILHSQLCQPCYSLCTTCVTSSTHCLSCVDIAGVLMLSNTCQCLGSGYFLYFDEATQKDTCVSCPPLCGNCDGVGQGQCKSCVLNSGAIFTLPGNCACPENMFYNSRSDSCESCHKLCDGCFGSSSEDCKKCKALVGFAVEYKLNTCVSDCSTLPSYYSSGSSCLRCNEDCNSCIGPNQNQCTSCASPIKFMLDFTCVLSCDSNYYVSNKACHKCHSTCKECTNAGMLGCSSCSNSFLLDKQCHSNCPSGTFADFDNWKCKACPHSCGACVSTTNCTSCNPGFYLITSTNTCVEAANCPLGSYPDIDQRVCQKCHYTCLSCLGPFAGDCTSCNITKGYMKLKTNYGTCDRLVCSGGTYLDSLAMTCLPCNSRCMLCDGPTVCLECKTGFLTMVIEGSNKVNCQGCPRGYKLNSTNKCSEICGDGLNLGTFECDDGNLINGDGCDKSCKLESGFQCEKQCDGPDICKDILPPYATLSISKGNVLEINFNEEVQFTIPSDIAETMIEIRLEGVQASTTNIPCKFTRTYRAYELFNRLRIVTNLTYGLKGTEVFIVKFLNSSLIQDKSENSLATKMLSVNALRQIYLSNGAATVGSIIASSTTVTFVMTIGLNPFKSAHSFWVFVNMLQYISFLPLIDCVIPGNLEYFITKFFGVSKVSIPFEYLPTWVPNPLVYLEKFNTDSFNERFQKLGYTSLNFIYNFSSQLFTMFTVLMISGFLGRLKKTYEYNSSIRLFLECYLGMTFCALLNLWCVFAVWFIFLAFRVGESPGEEIKTTEFKNTYGIIFDDLYSSDSIIVNGYQGVYLIRRFIYAFILVTLTKYPLLQLILINIITLIPMFIYLIVIRPFKGRISNTINIYDEFVLLLTYGSTLIFNLVSIDSSTLEYYGWGILVLLLIALVVTWLLLIPTAISDLRRLICGSDKKTSAQTIDDKQSVRFTEKLKTSSKNIYHRKRVLVHNKKTVIKKQLTTKEDEINDFNSESVFKFTEPCRDYDKVSNVIPHEAHTHRPHSLNENITIPNQLDLKTKEKKLDDILSFRVNSPEKSNTNKPFNKKESGSVIDLPGGESSKIFYLLQDKPKKVHNFLAASNKKQDSVEIFKKLANKSFEHDNLFGRRKSYNESDNEIFIKLRKSSEDLIKRVFVKDNKISQNQI